VSSVGTTTETSLFKVLWLPKLTLSCYLPLFFIFANNRIGDLCRRLFVFINELRIIYAEHRWFRICWIYDLLRRQGLTRSIRFRVSRLEYLTLIGFFNFLHLFFRFLNHFFLFLNWFVLGDESNLISCFFQIRRPFFISSELNLWTFLHFLLVS